MIETKDLIIHDKNYLLCISLATKSRSKAERYGSLLLNDELVIGHGYNHKFRGDEIVKMPGWGNHAEVNALNDALRKGFDVKGSVCYVAGYFPKEGSLHIRKKLNFSCPKCPDYLGKYGIIGFYVPLIHGWKFLTIDEALEYAKEFKTNRHEKVMMIGRSEHNIKDLSLDNLIY